MHTEELNKILRAVQELDNFAAQTPLSRGWHANWQQLYQHVLVNVQAAAAASKPADHASETPEDTK